MSWRLAGVVMTGAILTTAALAAPADAAPTRPTAAGAAREADEPVITDHFRRSHRTFDVGNLVVDGVSVPSVRMCYNSKPCETIQLPVPDDAPGGARVDSVTGPTAATATATGVTYSSEGELPTIWRVDASHVPLNRWVVDTATLTDRFGTGLDAVAVTGVSAEETWYVLRRTTGGPRGTDRLVQRLGDTLAEANPLGCSVQQGQTWNDLATIRGPQLAALGHCGNAAARLPKVFIRKPTGFVDVTRNLPAGVVWTRAADIDHSSYAKAGLLVSGEPVGGGPTVTYRLSHGTWFPVPDPPT